MVRIVELFRAWKKGVDGLLWFASYFDLAVSICELFSWIHPVHTYFWRVVWLTLSLSLFPRPKELNDSDRQKSGIVYKISCTRCNFVYYGPAERSL